MSIGSEIERLGNAKDDIADAIEDMGVEVPSGTKLDGLATLIRGGVNGHIQNKNNPHEVTAQQIGAKSIEPDYQISGVAGWYKFLVVPVESNRSRKIVLRLVESYSTVGAAIVSMYLNRNYSGEWTSTSANMISSTVINNTDIGFVLNEQDNEVEYYYRKRSNASGVVLVNVLESVARTGSLVDLSEYFETTSVSGFPSNGTYFYPSQDGAGNLIPTTYATKAEVNELDAQDVGAIPDTELDGETETAIGAVASFETASEQIFTGIIANIEPVQDLHGYDNPWPAGSGKNKVAFPYASPDGVYAGVTFTTTGEKIVASGETNNSFNFTLANVTLPAGNYVMSVDGTHTNVQFRARVSDTNISTLNPANTLGTFTLESESEVTFDIVRTSAAISLNTHFQVESGSTPTAWTPYSNICPISGLSAVNVWRTGKNLADPSKIYLMAIGSGPQNWIYIDSPDGVYRTLKVDQLKAGTYTISTNLNNAYFLRYRYTANGSVVGVDIQDESNNYTFTLTNDVTDFGISFRNTSSTVITESFAVQLEIGSTATAYEPYSGNQYTMQLGQTVYGGTLDVTTGVLTVDRAMVDLGTLSWTRFESAALSGGGSFGAHVAGRKLGFVYDEMLCSAYRVSPEAGASHNPAPADKLIFMTTASSSDYIYIVDSGYSDANTFKTAMSGVQLVYTLATPVTIQLTPTQISALQGTNNLWADTGDSTIVYRTGKVALLSDVANEAEASQAKLTFLKNSIDSIDSELSNVDANKANKSIVAPVEPTTTASANYEVGSHLIQNEALYEVIAAIASGETIEPGTNVEETTVMGISEELISGLGNLGRLKCVSVWGAGDGWTRNITLASGSVQVGLVITWGTVVSKDSVFLFSKTTSSNLHLKTIVAPSQSGLSVTADSSNATIVVTNGIYGMGIAVVTFYGNLPTISLQE